jgi:hypothetical protein
LGNSGKYCDGRSSPGTIPQSNFTMMQTNQFFRDGQSQANPLLLLLFPINLCEFLK